MTKNDGNNQADVGELTGLKAYKNQEANKTNKENAIVENEKYFLLILLSFYGRES